jgi:hypothetical protein
MTEYIPGLGKVFIEYDSIEEAKNARSVLIYLILVIIWKNLLE